MKKIVVNFSKAAIAIVLISCAAAPPDKRQNRYEQGLKYSEEIYSQPIDILKNEDMVIRKSADLSENLAQKKDRFYSVQIASFENKRNAVSFLKAVNRQIHGYHFRLYFSENLWRILTDGKDSRPQAQRLLEDMKNQGFSDAWIFEY